MVRRNINNAVEWKNCRRESRCGFCLPLLPCIVNLVNKFVDKEYSSSGNFNTHYELLCSITEVCFETLFRS